LGYDILFTTKISYFVIVYTKTAKNHRMKEMGTNYEERFSRLFSVIRDSYDRMQPDDRPASGSQPAARRAAAKKVLHTRASTQRDRFPYW
jgi:hypothetical protein